MAEECIFVKIWNVGRGDMMVAACDCALVGKKFKEGSLTLDASKEFYEGERMTLEAAIDILRTATNANIVGEKAIECGIAAGIIHEDCVIRIGGVPHAQFVCL